MANSAQELLDIIRRWQANEMATAKATRGLADNEERGRHVDAAKCLHEIKSQLEAWDAQGQGAVSAPFWTMWSSLVNAVFVWSRGWTSSQPQAAGRFNDNDVKQLAFLAVMLKSAHPTNNPRLQEGVGTLLEWIEEVRALAEEDAGLAVELRDRITALCDEILKAATAEDVVSAAEFVELLNDMWRYCAEAARADTHRHPQWKSKRSTVGVFAAGFGLNMVSNAVWLPVPLLLTGVAG